MTVKNYFDRAAGAEKWGSWIFKLVFALSLAALLVPEPYVLKFVNPVLIVACLAGVVLSILTLVWQNGGNQLLRASQLTNAFQVPIGETARDTYYNNSFPPSVDRLAATTLENTLFTTAVLDRMLIKERVCVFLYVAVFVLFMGYRGSSTGALLIFAQAVFSVDVILHWLRMERFLYRVGRVRQQLHLLFVQGGHSGGTSGLAIALAAFADYECAKDEVAMPLDGKIFAKINDKVSKDWDELRKSLKIP